MTAARAGTLLGDAAGASLDDVSWAKLTPWHDELRRLDTDLRADLSNLSQLLERIPLAVWGQVLMAPDKLLGRADIFLPAMPPAAVQEAWTGLSGGRLLRQSVAFVEQIVLACCEAGIRPNEASAVDFGVGWGRLAMLWLKYAAPDRLVGCDAWPDSLRLARKGRMPFELVESDPLLETLPVPEGSQDVVYAFSVFTSLGDVAFPSCLAGVSRMLRPGGVAVFTVRPPEYWTLRDDVKGAVREAEVSDFFFRPYPEKPQYGDASVSLNYLDEVCEKSGLSRPSLEWFPADPHQVVVRARRLADRGVEE